MADQSEVAPSCRHSDYRLSSVYMCAQVPLRPFLRCVVGCVYFGITVLSAICARMEKEKAWNLVSYASNHQF